MRTEVVVALIAGGVALSGAAISAWTSLRTARLQIQVQELEHKVSTKEELLAQNVSRYREPLVRAAFDLQSRLYNIVRQDFLRYLRAGQPAEKEYACLSTVFLLAQYLGWEEILRRGIQFLDLGDVERNRRLAERFERITNVLSTDRLSDPNLRVFHVQQRAIGELMIDPVERAGGVSQCIGYAAFRARLNDADFAPWFSQLLQDVDRLAAEEPADHGRLIALQHALLNLIDFLDDPPTRYPAQFRVRI